MDSYLICLSFISEQTERDFKIFCDNLTVSHWDSLRNSVEQSLKMRQSLVGNVFSYFFFLDTNILKQNLQWLQESKYFESPAWFVLMLTRGMTSYFTAIVLLFVLQSIYSFLVKLLHRFGF